MKVVLDTNIWISILLGHRFPLIYKILTSDKLTVCVCDELLAEIRNVSSRNKIRKYVQEYEVELLLQIISLHCKSTILTTQVESEIRDAKDIYLLALAKQLKAKLIVSGDKDLLDLKKFQSTDIITWAEFQQLIKQLGIIEE